MIYFSKINFKLRIFGQPLSAAEVPLVIQYFHFEEQDWVPLYEVTTLKWSFSLVKAAADVDVTNELEVYFFDKVKSGHIPHVRIIPGEGAPIPETVEKDLVVSRDYSFGLVEEIEEYQFNFGNLWIGSEEVIQQNENTFANFIPVTTFFEMAEENETVPVPINELYTNIVSEIETAARSSESSAFKLSNISLKLKAVIHNEEDTINASLLNLTNSENINGNAISELVFDITPVQQEGRTLSGIPNLTGFTETAVRRILKTLGLKLNPVYQKNLDVVNGDSFKQSPAAGEMIQPNQLVTVIFSKHG